MTSRKLNSSNVDDFRPGCRQLQHFFIRDSVQLLCFRNNPRVSAEDTINIGVDLADVSVQCCCERHRRGVRPTSPQSRNVSGVVIEPLEARDNGNCAVIESLPNAGGRHINDASPTVLGVRHHAGLTARKRAGVEA